MCLFAHASFLCVLLDGDNKLHTEKTVDVRFTPYNSACLYADPTACANVESEALGRSSSPRITSQRLNQEQLPDELGKQIESILHAFTVIQKLQGSYLSIAERNT